MAFDYKKEYKEFYLPKRKPDLVTVPAMNFIAVRGKGDPNEEGGDYKTAMGLLYGLAFTIKLSRLGEHQIEGYFDYVVPPLEGLCVQCMHVGPYDEEPATLEAMERFMEEQGLVPDFSEDRRHHEIYLSDVRRCKPERLKTVIRVPVREA